MKKFFSNEGAWISYISAFALISEPMLYSGSFENMYLVGPIRKAFKDPIQVPILVIGHFDQCFNLQLNFKLLWPYGKHSGSLLKSWNIQIFLHPLHQHRLLLQHLLLQLKNLLIFFPFCTLRIAFFSFISAFAKSASSVLYTSSADSIPS